MVEAGTNVAFGLVVAVATQLVVFPTRGSSSWCRAAKHNGAADASCVHAVNVRPSSVSPLAFRK